MSSAPIRTEWISVASDGGRMDAYLALPPAGQGPGLLLLQEIFGVNEHIRAVADQYALAGFSVLAPDLFWRDAPLVQLAPQVGALAGFAVLFLLVARRLAKRWEVA